MPFPNGISPKVNVIAQGDFELAYYDIAVQHVNLRHKDSTNCVQTI